MRSQECPLWRIPAKLLPAIPEMKVIASGTFSPQPGSIPVTSLHPQLSLAQQQAAKVFAAAVPEAPIAAALKEKYNGNVTEVKTPSVPEPAESRPAPCKDHRIGLFTCPDGKSHFITEQNRGRVCSAISIPINQLPHDECPLDREIRLKGTLPEKFRPASDDGFGNKIVKPAPYKISKSKLLDSERDSLVDSLIDHTAFTPKDIEQIDELVKVNREGWTCRFDLVEAAVMMLLAKAEEE